MNELRYGEKVFDLSQPVRVVKGRTTFLGRIDSVRSDFEGTVFDIELVVFPGQRIDVNAEFVFPVEDHDD